MTGQATQDVTAGGHKRPYSPPRLVVYGDLRRLTRGPGKASTLVDGGGTNSKT